MSRLVQTADEPQSAAVSAASRRTPHFAGSTGLFVLAAFYTLYFARDFFLPIVFAVMLYFVFLPVTQVLARARVPRAAAAAVVLGTVLLAAAAGAAMLGAPARAWTRKLPETIERMQNQLRNFEPAQKVTQAVEEVNRIAADTGADPIEPKLQSAAGGGSLLGWTTGFFAQTGATIILLYFLLAYGDRWIARLDGFFGTRRDKRVAQIVGEAQHTIAHYLSTITAINAGLGAAIAAAMWALGLPSPLLWGVMGGLLNYIPYVGAYVGIAVLTIVSFLEYDPPRAFAAPAAYWALTTLESSFVTPTLLGRSLTLNPIVIFLSIFFWGWLWGTPGMLLAVPILMTFKIISDHAEPLKKAGAFITR